MYVHFLKKIKRTLSALICTLLIMSSFALVPMSHTGQLQKAEALFGGGDTVFVLGGNGTIQQTLTAVSSKITAVTSGLQLGIQNSLFVKEYFMDGIVNGIAKMVLKSMTQSIVTWINSGFQGKPAFVTDLKQFMLDRADQIAGDFIYNDPSLNFLCSPFQLDVKIALATSYQQNAHDGFKSKSQCTLSDVTDNVDGFLSGSFTEGGGWASWFEVTQNPVNTPTGAYFAAEGELQARIVDDKGNTVNNLAWGQGFLSFKVCSEAQKASGDIQNCDITTPGSVIANQINKSLGAGQDSLIAADEIDEIVGALFAQLAKQAITGAQGLLGLGGNSSYSDNSFGSGQNSSYLDALKKENPTKGGGSGPNPFEYSKKIEEGNILLQKTIISTIRSAEQKFTTAKSAYDARIASQLILNGGVIHTVQNCFPLTTLRTLSGDKNTAKINIQIASSTIATLMELNDQYITTEDPSEQLTVIEVYNNMISGGQIKSPVDNTRLEIFIAGDFKDKIDTFNTNTDKEITRCSSRSGGGGGYGGG